MACSRLQSKILKGTVSHKICNVANVFPAVSWRDVIVLAEHQLQRATSLDFLEDKPIPARLAIHKINIGSDKIDALVYEKFKNITLSAEIIYSFCPETERQPFKKDGSDPAT